MCSSSPWMAYPDLKMVPKPFFLVSSYKDALSILSGIPSDASHQRTAGSLRPIRGRSMVLHIKCSQKELRNILRYLEAVSRSHRCPEKEFQACRTALWLWICRPFHDVCRQHCESVNPSLGKSAKLGPFPNHEAVFKLLYLRIREPGRKWNSAAKQNWPLVLNRLMVNGPFSDRISRYLKYQPHKKM